MSSVINGQKIDGISIVSWNVNGVRSLKEPLKDVLDRFDADVICLQETKITRDQINSDIAIVPGYNAFYSFSLKRSGYSGVATFCKKHFSPFAAEQGLSDVLSKRENNQNNVGFYGDVSKFSFEELTSLDTEGRTVITCHKFRDEKNNEKELVVINVYCPRADPDNEERKLFKMKFYELLQERSEALIDTNRNVVIVGDINMSHKPIDHCDPDDDDESFNCNPGRIWMNNFLSTLTKLQASNEGENCEPSQSGKFIDTFRHFYPTKENIFTCWQTKTNARLTNYGTRIDYIFADIECTRFHFSDSLILSDVEGSDHCPIKAILNGSPISSQECPSICSKFWPEFSGKQQKMSRFVIKDTEIDSIHKIESSSNENESFNSKRTPGKRPVSSKSSKTAKKLKSEKNSILNFLNVTSKKGEISKEKSIDSSAYDLPPAVSNPTISQEPNMKSVNAWKNILKGPPVAPLCKGHNEPCLLQTVKKQGPNYKRQFYVCARPAGHSNNSEARCNFFKWYSAPKLNKLN